jgi:tRNA-specific 2-thiouridylase
MNKGRKITVAMSGGVDSSVVAYLLKEKGDDVRGIFLRLADVPDFDESLKSAEEIADSLDVPFSILDLRKEFQQEIINDFLEKNEKGETPNPCVVCNKKIKFGLLLKNALQKSDYLATGHYVKIKKGKHYRILKGKDETRDQSYFLWKLEQEQLKHLLFPLGKYCKKEVQEIARKAGIESVKRPESREICFVQGKLKEFLKENINPKKGKIVDKKGNVLGEHDGLYFYTIGQRKGIDIGGLSSPFYVLDKELRENNLIVTQDEEDLFKKEIKLKDVNWISGEEPELPIEVEAKIRYRHNSCPAKIKKGYLLEFKSPQRAITPGQSAVIYKGEELLGGGIIA